MYQTLVNIIWLLVLYYSYRFILGIYEHCIRRSYNHLKRYSQSPSVTPWACITGATAGIGLAFANLLADKGFNILLLSRNPEKLKKVEAEISKKGVKVSSIASELGCDQTLQYYHGLIQQMSKYDIGLFINNAGIIDLGDFVEASPQKLNQVIELNLYPYAMLTRLILPKLKARKARSGIINVSSAAGGDFLLPKSSLYIATKAFEDHFTQALAHSCENLDILSLKPGPVTTAQSGMVQAHNFVKSAICALGKAKHSNGHWSSAVFSFIFSRLPLSVLNSFMGMAIKENEKRMKKE